MLVIGSVAAKQSFPEWRDPGDIDIIGSGKDWYDWVAFMGDNVIISDSGPMKKTAVSSRTGKHIEWEIWGPNGPATTSTQIMDERYGRPFAEPTAYASPEVLLMLKLSHRYLKDSPHFWKTMKDIWTLRESVGGANNDTELIELLKLREDETYDYAHPNLDRSKDDFFADDSITYYWDHDSAHLAVAVEDEPAYVQYLKPGSAVAVSMNTFDSLPMRTRINGVVEEAGVLALERSLIPFWLESGDVEGARAAEFDAFRMALMKVCSSITSGRFREFAWEHAYQAQARYIMQYSDGQTLVDRFLTSRDSGTLVRLQA